MKYIRLELGTGYCGETSIEYYHVPDDYELSEGDYDTFEQKALDHAECYGHEYADYCDENDLDPETGEGWDEYVGSITDYCCYETVEDPEMDDGDDCGEW